jgi:hypothetical protein
VPEDVTDVEFQPDASEGDSLTIRVQTPASWVDVMGDIDITGRCLMVYRAHVQSAAG